MYPTITVLSILEVSLFIAIVNAIMDLDSMCLHTVYYHIHFCVLVLLSTTLTITITTTMSLKFRPGLPTSVLSVWVTAGEA